MNAEVARITTALSLHLPRWIRDPKGRRYRLALLLVPMLFAGLAIVASPFGMPMPDYWIDALQLAKTGVIQQHFTPSGYPLTVALGIRLAPAAHPAAGLVLEQAMLHVCLALVLWRVMRRLGANPVWALLGMMLLQANPELVTSVMKVWDVPLSTLALLFTTLAALWVLQKGTTVARCAVLGGAWAFGCFDRPNYVGLAPALLLALWWGCKARPSRPIERGDGVSRWLLQVGVLLAGLVSVFSVCSAIAYHSIRMPENGPYNLFAGTNAYSRSAMLEHLNAEPSLVPALAADHVDMGTRTPDSVSLAPYYKQASWRFVRLHPGSELGLVAVKLFTLLRPDTKVHPLLSAGGVGKGVLALFVPLWIAVVFWFRLRRPKLWTEADSLVALLAVLYVLPFLVTNADPRFRTPLDLLLGAHVVGMLGRRGSSIEVSRQS